MKRNAVLNTIEGNHRVTIESDREFYDQFELAILLALKEAGTLNETQYQYAERKLNASTILKWKPH